MKRRPRLFRQQILWTQDRPRSLPLAGCHKAADDMQDSGSSAARWPRRRDDLTGQNAPTHPKAEMKQILLATALILAPVGAFAAFEIT